jgi:hypothetical protein
MGKGMDYGHLNQAFEQTLINHSILVFDLCELKEIAP